MSDEETPGAAPDSREADVLQYDFLKFLTTLAILVLGGALSLASTKVHLPRGSLVVVIILVSMAGAAAATGAEAVVAARLAGRPLGWFGRRARGISMGLLGAGTGFFLSLWTQGTG